MRRDRSGRHDRGNRRQHKRPPRIQVVRDAEEVFRAAIAAGVLSGEPSERNWAGNYLYMFHDEDGTAWFKHRARPPGDSGAGALKEIETIREEEAEDVANLQEEKDAEAGTEPAGRRDAA